VTDFRVVLTTTPDQASAQKLAKSLVEKGLAACVQISAPVESLYVWKSKLETSSEIQLFIKSRRDLFQEIQTQIRAEHPYENPEILEIPVSAGSENYLNWMAQNLRSLAAS